MAYHHHHKQTSTLEEMVGSIAFLSLTRRPSLQNVRLARGSSRPGSVHLHLTSGPIFSITSNRTMPPSTTNSSPILTSANHNHQETKKVTDRQTVCELHSMNALQCPFQHDSSCPSAIWADYQSSRSACQRMETHTFGKSFVIHNSGAFREALEFANSEYPLLPILDKQTTTSTRRFQLYSSIFLVSYIHFSSQNLLCLNCFALNPTSRLFPPQMLPT